MEMKVVCGAVYDREDASSPKYVDVYCEQEEPELKLDGDDPEEFMQSSDFHRKLVGPNGRSGNGRD